MNEPRVWLIGENNPYSDNPHHALYPYPPGCAGFRLARLLRLSDEEYLARFERRNLLSQDRWSAPASREAARKLITEVRDGDRLVLCGARVSKAFGYAFEPISVHGAADLRAAGGAGAHYRVLVIPHPSGLSRLWNEPGMVERVRDAVLALCET